ncbi:MAG: PEP-CTERM sorting domain-containing protein [Desulfuromonadaceae bacterium]|nr:PEP-CTERM sorting domain-containing protein [Desulfuromonadaceae bacterium]
MRTLKIAFAAKIAVAAFILAAATLLGSGSAYATPYGTEITKYDGLAPNGLGAAKEDNEAESGMVQSQVWDLEGFFLKNKALTIAGGYNFYTGQEGMAAGDIFIDINGDAVYAPNLIPNYNYNPGYKNVSNSNFKYDYVLDVNWGNGTFDLVKLTDSSLVQDTEYGAQYNKASNPWLYVSGGSVISTGSFNTYGKVSKDDTGFSGWGTDNRHFVATFDISPIDLSNGALFHNTMQCGNDNLIGQSAPVPEPGSMVLLGLGVFSLAVYGKRRINRD